MKPTNEHPPEDAPKPPELIAFTEDQLDELDESQVDGFHKFGK